MAIVLTGRNVDVSAHYRAHVADKLERLERYNSHVVRYDVELYHENNPRQAKACQRVEITVKGNGPTMHTEGRGHDFYAGFAAAVGKLEARLRRRQDRHHDHRRVCHGSQKHTSVAVASAPVSP